MTIMEKLKDIMPGIVMSLLISLVANLVVFTSSFSSLQANVLQNSEQIKAKVSKEEFNAILEGQNKLEAIVQARLGKIEDKLDRIIERRR
jgi:hypothetical protein